MRYNGTNKMRREVADMISLILSFAVLLVGFFTYGRLAEKMFGPDDRPTPAIAINETAWTACP